ncbi:hypothetical protein D3C77_686170 [compost metagenome]
MGASVNMAKVSTTDAGTTASPNSRALPCIEQAEIAAAQNGIVSGLDLHVVVYAPYSVIGALNY